MLLKEPYNVKKLLIATLFFSALTLTAAAQTSSPLTVPAPRQMQPAAPTVEVNGTQNSFPPVNPSLFTSPVPTMETVNSFLNALWGYEPGRIWSVQGIETTAAPGVVRITVLLTDRSGNSGVQRAIFFMTPDGKHVIGSEVLPFGAQPFAEVKRTMIDRVNGPAHGAAGKELLLVEFADLQCPSCKSAQTAMSQLARDYPQARIVFEDDPQEGTHPASLEAAEVGVCVAQKSDAAFFTYAQAVYDTQDALMAAGKDAALKTAVTKAGLDAEAVMACASSPATLAVVQATEKLGQDLGINSVPAVVINGRIVPLSNVAYETIEKVLRHEAELDGVNLPAPQPKLTALP